MWHRFLSISLVLALLVVSVPATVRAQDLSGELAATLEVLSPGVQVRRVNTVNWITVQKEAIVGVGDVIRTDETGKARITFFADGVDTEVQPSSEFRIDRFEGDGESFSLSIAVLLGQSLQRIERLLDDNSSYDVQTPGMELTVRGTQFMVRVEPQGRSAALVFDGTAVAAAGGEAADVPTGYGVRAAQDGTLSDVVVASTFDQLDAALDGCTATVRTVDDVSINVRLGPGRELGRVGFVDGGDVTLFMGVNTSGGWYRIPYRGGFGWILASDVTLDAACAGLRVFPDTQVEDPALYEGLGEVIDAADLATPPAPEAPTATPDAAPDAE